MNGPQDECDKQSVKIFNEFRKKRNVKEKMDKVRDSVYGSSSALSTTTSMTGSFTNNSAGSVIANCFFLISSERLKYAN